MEVKKMKNKKRGAKMEYKITEKITQERIDEIVDLKEKYGLTAETFLDQAAKKSSKWHDCFVWDNTKAGHLYRLQQARVILNEVKVIIVGDPKPRYAFESVTVTTERKGDESENHREYKTILEITDTEELKEQVIQRAFRELIYWKEKYELYSEFSGVISSIVRLENKMKDEVNKHAKGKQECEVTAA